MPSLYGTVTQNASRASCVQPRLRIRTVALHAIILLLAALDDLLHLPLVLPGFESPFDLRECQRILPLLALLRANGMCCPRARLGQLPLPHLLEALWEMRA